MPDVYDQADKFAAALRARDTRASSTVVDAYGNAWARIRAKLAAETAKAWAELEEAGMANAPRADRRAWMLANHPSWVYQRERYQATMLEIEAAILEATQAATLGTIHAQRDAIAMAADHAEQAIRSGLEDTAAGFVANYTVPNMRALEAMVGFTADGTPLADLLGRLGPDTARSITDELVAGMAEGLNPRQVAARCRDLFGGDLTRALRVARTETMRAYREAAHASYEANADVVDGWTWVSALQPRTCAACWAQHGTVHPVEERMAEHVMGRCAMVPLTKTWADLGLEGVPETRAELADGAEEFKALSPADQLKVLGPTRYQLYDAGELELADMATTVDDPVWGPSTRVANLRTARAQAADRRARETSRAAELARLEELAGQGVTPEAWEQAGADLEELKARVRAAAARTADDFTQNGTSGQWMQIGRPPRRIKQVDPVTGRVSYKHPPRQGGGEQVGGEWDWFYQLGEDEQKRIRRHMPGKAGDADRPHVKGAARRVLGDNPYNRHGASPDQIHHGLVEAGVFGPDATVDEVMDWWAAEMRRHDGARALARGRPPRYISADTLVPDVAADYPGLDLADLFDPDGRRALARYYTDDATEYARRALGTPRGRAPWTMSAGDYADELRDLEDRAARITPTSHDEWFGPDYDPADRAVLDRLADLRPDGIDPDGTLDPLELHRRIADTARLAGLADAPPARASAAVRRRLRQAAADALRDRLT